MYIKFYFSLPYLLGTNVWDWRKKLLCVPEARVFYYFFNSSSFFFSSFLSYQYICIACTYFRLNIIKIWKVWICRRPWTSYYKSELILGYLLLFECHSSFDVKEEKIYIFIQKSDHDKYKHMRVLHFYWCGGWDVP